MRTRFVLAALVIAIVPACNCGPGSSVNIGGGGGGAGRDGGAGGGSGGGSGGGFGGGFGGGTGDPDAGRCDVIAATLRDFQDTHPDFEQFLGSERGIAANTLDGQHKPVHASASPTAVTSGPSTFAQWYRDVPGVNEPLQVLLPLTSPRPGVFVYDNSDFFPLDGLGFGNQGRAHNFHFTTEIHTSFTYRGGEVFTFRGDDDVFVFVNRRLALDLGGVHAVEEDTIDFDAKAGQLGIVRGQTYALDVFHAERHTTESNFRIETSIDCFGAAID